MNKSNCAMKAKSMKPMSGPAKMKLSATVKGKAPVKGGGSASVKSKVMAKEKAAMGKKVKPNTY